MIIKNIKAGNAIPYTPEEALFYAIRVGLSQMKDPDFVYWITDAKDLKVHTFSVQKLAGADYEAFSTGTVLVGKTEVPADIFQIPKAYQYKIHYKSAKDPIGQPHLAVPEFDISVISTNPADNVGPLPEEALNKDLKKDISLGEIIPSSGGKVRGKK